MLKFKNISLGIIKEIIYIVLLLVALLGMTYFI